MEKVQQNIKTKTWRFTVKVPNGDISIVQSLKLEKDWIEPPAPAL